MRRSVLKINLLEEWKNCKIEYLCTTCLMFTHVDVNTNNIFKSRRNKTKKYQNIEIAMYGSIKILK